MSAAYFEDHPTDPNKVILRKRPCPYCQDTPRTWVGLTQEEFEKLIADAGFTRSDLMMIGSCVEQIVDLVENRLKEKNT